MWDEVDAVLIHSHLVYSIIRVVVGLHANR